MWCNPTAHDEAAKQDFPPRPLIRSIQGQAAPAGAHPLREAAPDAPGIDQRSHTCQLDDSPYRVVNPCPVMQQCVDRDLTVSLPGQTTMKARPKPAFDPFPPKPC